MTDASLPITQSTVEQFSHRYLTSLGCSITVEGDRWTVEIPSEVNTELGEGELSLICQSDDDEVADSAQLLHPESSVFQTIVEGAVSQMPVGSMSVTEADVDVQLPGWATESDLRIGDATFTPYYDRTAVCVLFRVSIETVSEYETELLQAVSFDTRSKERLPGLTRTYLDFTTADREQLRETTFDQPQDEIRAHLQFARQEVQEIVQPEIDEIHANASQAANVELEEYRQFQQHRIEELQQDVESLTTRIDDLSQQVEQATEPDDRREALRERKRLREDQAELEERVSEIRGQREAGFPNKQREIRDRHKLDVRIEPAAVTFIRYETGDLRLTLVRDSRKQTVTVSYGSGAGVIDTLTCSHCERILTSRRPARLSDSGAICRECDIY